MTEEEIKFFDKISESWDDEEILSTPERISSILSKINIKPDWNILDLGTGTGVLIPYLSKIVNENGRIVGIDISGGMLEKAKKKFGHLKNVTFIKLDFEKEEIEGKYNLILLFCVYPHIHNPEQTIRKLLNKNLLPEGRIVIAFPTDENFINNIHKEKKAESELLPSASNLCKKFKIYGFNSKVVAANENEYIVVIFN